MTVSVIGTGRMGKGLVRTLSPIIPGLKWGSRSIDRVQQLIKESEFEEVKGVNLDEALEADIIIHALWFRDVIPLAQQHAQQLTGKILVDWR